MFGLWLGPCDEHYLDRDSKKHLNNSISMPDSASLRQSGLTRRRAPLPGPALWTLPLRARNASVVSKVTAQVGLNYSAWAVRTDHV